MYTGVVVSITRRILHSFTIPLLALSQHRWIISSNWCCRYLMQEQYSRYRWFNMRLRRMNLMMTLAPGEWLSTKRTESSAWMRNSGHLYFILYNKSWKHNANSSLPVAWHPDFYISIIIAKTQFVLDESGMFSFISWSMRFNFNFIKSQKLKLTTYGTNLIPITSVKHFFFIHWQWTTTNSYEMILFKLLCVIICVHFLWKPEVRC